MKLTKEQHELAQNRVEEFLSLVSDEMSNNFPNVMKLAIMSDVVIAYEKNIFQ